MELSQYERQTNTLSSESLQSAVEHVRMNGYVILERVLSPDFIAELHGAFLELFNAYIEKTDPNRGANRYQMNLPFQLPFCDNRIIENSLVMPIVESLIGTDYLCPYFASDTPMPGAEYQPVHSDGPTLFPDVPIPLPPYSIVINFPLVDFREDNGPVEIWPGGTHHHTFSGNSDMQAVAEDMYSIPVIMPAGSILIRDARMWHRGTPNHSDGARPNMALIYSRPWYKIRYPALEIPRRIHNALSERAKNFLRDHIIVD
jgi:ectoine hydroxylase-related dioxygenase (phytanoyl-CoA dioxygenase family)